LWALVAGQNVKALFDVVPDPPKAVTSCAADWRDATAQLRACRMRVTAMIACGWNWRFAFMDDLA
jgi:hypothetical protein